MMRTNSLPKKERRGRCCSWVNAGSPQSSCPLNASLSFAGPLSLYSTGLHAAHTPLQNTMFSYGNSRWTCKLQEQQKAIYSKWRVCNPQSSHVPSRRDRGGQDTWLGIPLAGVCGSALSREQWRLVLDDVRSNLEKIPDCELLCL